MFVQSKRQFYAREPEISRLQLIWSLSQDQFLRRNTNLSLEFCMSLDPKPAFFFVKVFCMTCFKFCLPVC